MLAYHPTQNAVLLKRYGEMGEYEFCVDQGRLARQWIAANPGKFAEITLTPRVVLLERHSAAGEGSVARRS